MELEDVVKEPRGIIEDSTLSGMSLKEFYKTMVSVVFPGCTIFYAEDEDINNELEYSHDDIGSILYSARLFAKRRKYYIGTGIREPIQIPEFTKDDRRYIDRFQGIEGIRFRPYSKHPLYMKAECLTRFIGYIEEFIGFAAHGIYRPNIIIDGLAPWLQYRTEIFSDLAVTIIKWLSALLSISNRNVFVDYLANSEDYHELYVELVQFIHKHLTQQENTAKFEL